MAVLRITEFTDPACPFAWSAEPVRRALSWRYGDAIEWSLRLVGLAETREEYADKGLTPAVLAGSFSRLAAEHGMPIDTAERDVVAATVPACRAVVAARLHAPGSERALLRALRLRHFGGEALDEAATLAGAAADAGLDADAFADWLEDPAVEDALREDLAAARDPLPAAKALDHKLASWSGGRRYTCPSYEIARLDDPDRVLAVPGFQPATASEVAIANLAPELERRDAPEDVADVLRWADEPLASAEVAAVADVDRFEVRQRLGRAATERPFGQDGFWSLSAAAA